MSQARPGNSVNSRSGLWASSSSITWELGGNKDSQVPPSDLQNGSLGVGVGVGCCTQMNKPSRCFVFVLEFENWCWTFAL